MIKNSAKPNWQLVASATPWGQYWVQYGLRTWTMGCSAWMESTISKLATDTKPGLRSGLCADSCSKEGLSWAGEMRCQETHAVQRREGNSLTCWFLWQYRLGWLSREQLCRRAAFYLQRTQVNSDLFIWRDMIPSFPAGNTFGVG